MAPIKKLIEQQKRDNFKHQFESFLLNSLLPGSDTSYKISDREKFSKVVLFF